MLYFEVVVAQDVGIGTGIGTLVGVIMLLLLLLLFLGSSLRRLEMLMDFASPRGDTLR